MGSDDAEDKHDNDEGKVEKKKKKKDKKERGKPRSRSRSRGRSRARRTEAKAHKADRRRSSVRRSASTVGSSGGKAVLKPARANPAEDTSGAASGSKSATAETGKDDGPAKAESPNPKLPMTPEEFAANRTVAAVRQAKLEGRLYSTRWASDADRQAELKKHEEAERQQAATKHGSYTCEVCGRHVGGGAAGSYQHKRSAYHLAAWIYWRRSGQKDWQECVADGKAWAAMLVEKNEEGPDDEDVKDNVKSTSKTTPVTSLQGKPADNKSLQGKPADNKSLQSKPAEKKKTASPAPVRADPERLRRDKDPNNGGGADGGASAGSKSSGSRSLLLQMWEATLKELHS